ncbi:MAG: Unknown protein [uncultured Thiotrichaceae bacterium]|uniref:Ligand-binding protein SH3 n=1 Tax=uncultured Thiotrichaceae bacterium TaxID=298394 RepID=A0A6S6TAT7_9GAMM|nr:MAG: Unknown protein [uncultured Thiotrichaceae bacterium]
MFHPIEIPFGCVMLFNVVDLKDGVTVEDVEMALGEMCNVVKNTYGNDEGGFIGGQVYKNSGFVSDEGSLGKPRVDEGDLVIMTYWSSFEQHEKSHADAAFREKFDHLLTFCDNAYEVGYEMLWQGVPE